ncbi:hypothetical protein F5B19DRAFT_398868 [Rostrohypoxylon terebratum]|nr:hypothetical protein F5B19DRAFT_398868 [Rostrohypoxylon terebratum]
MIPKNIPYIFLREIGFPVPGTHCSRCCHDCLRITMSGHDSNNAGGDHGSNWDTVFGPAQVTGSIPASTGESTRQRAIGHRRQGSELIGYKYPPPDAEHPSKSSPEQLRQGTPEQSILQQILRIAGTDDGPYPLFTRPGTRPNTQTRNNIHPGDQNQPNLPNRAGSDGNVNSPATELPRAVSPISSFRLLGMTGEVEPSEDSQETPPPTQTNTRTSSRVNHHTMPRHRSDSGGYVANSEYFHIFECCSYIVTVDKVNFILYIFMIILIISIYVSSTVWNKSQYEEPKKLWVLGWLLGSIFALIILLACYQTRDANLKECGYPTGYDKNRDWIALGDMDDAANQRARFQDPDPDHAVYAGVPSPMFTEDISPYPNPHDTYNYPERDPNRLSVFSKAKITSKAKRRSQSAQSDSGAAGSSGPSIPLQDLTRRDSVRQEDEMAKAMQDRHRVLQEEEGQSAGRSTALAGHSERQFGEGLPPRDRWYREPRGSTSNLRPDHYDNGVAGPATGSSRMTNVGKAPMHSSSVATRFNELTPITERSGEVLSPRSTLLSSPQEATKSPSRSDEAAPSSPPAASAPRDSI